MAELINYGSNGSMAEQVKALYDGVCKVLTTHCKVNKLAMRSLQAMGYNGFKRWHRYRSRQFFEMKLCLSNELFDMFRIKGDFKSYDISYDPANMEEHLKSWEGALLDGIQELGTLRKKFFELTGMDSKIISKAMRKLACDYEKVGRLIMRFTESDWLTLDMHTVDDKLHCKYKGKEEKLGLRY